MQRPGMLASNRLVAFDLSGWIHMSHDSYIFHLSLAETILDTVVHCEIDGPCREVA